MDADSTSIMEYTGVSGVLTGQQSPLRNGLVNFQTTDGRRYSPA
jgi:hypothetical protein